MKKADEPVRWCSGEMPIKGRWNQSEKLKFHVSHLNELETLAGRQQKNGPKQKTNDALRSKWIDGASLAVNRAVKKSENELVERKNKVLSPIRTILCCHSSGSSRPGPWM